MKPLVQIAPARSNTLAFMSEWSNRLVQTIGEQIKVRRAELGLTAQELADRTEQLGHPISRSTISQFEAGTRKGRIVIGDLLILAEALATSIGHLMYPGQPDGNVERVPNVYTSAMSAKDELASPKLMSWATSAPDVWRASSIELSRGDAERLTVIRRDKLQNELEDRRLLAQQAYNKMVQVPTTETRRECDYALTLVRETEEQLRNMGAEIWPFSPGIDGEAGRDDG